MVCHLVAYNSSGLPKLSSGFESEGALRPAMNHEGGGHTEEVSDQPLLWNTTLFTEDEHIEEGGGCKNKFSSASIDKYSLICKTSKWTQGYSLFSLKILFIYF